MHAAKPARRRRRSSRKLTCSTGVSIVLASLKSTAQLATHVNISSASMWKAAAIPTTKRMTPSAPMIWLAAAVVHTPPGLSCAHWAAGAITRSTLCGFCGCAAGQIWRPYDVGTERELAGLQKEDAGRELPAVHAAQAPEHAAVASPARSPKVPGGHSVHLCMPRASA
jgi:hypothetical protein